MPAATAEASDTYVYTDADGSPSFRVKRKPGKQFAQEHWDGSHWRPGRNGTGPLPYRLPNLSKAVTAGQTVYVVEGEKDVHAAESLGVVATTNPGGAGKWTDELSEYLADADVLVVWDRDAPGRAHALDVADSLKRSGARVRFRRAASGKDLSDHVAAGLGLDDLAKLKPRAKPTKKKQEAKSAAAAETLPAVFQLVEAKLKEHARANGLPMPRPHSDRSGFEACCPSHHDRSPSLGVWLGDERAVVIKCQAGCDPQAVVSSLGIEWAEFASASREAAIEDDVLREVRQALAVIERQDERTTHLDDMLDLRALFDMPAPEWLVDGYLPAEGVAVIYGPEGVGKTLVLGSLALAVAFGVNWYDKAVNPAGGAPVLFYAGEGASGLGPRWQAWMAEFAPEHHATALEELEVAPIRLLPEAVNLEDEYEVARVVRSAREVGETYGQPVALVAFDSFIEFLGGDNEGESLDKASRAARAIAQLCGCCVLIGHHPNAAGLDRGTRHLSFRVHSRMRMERWDGSGETWLVAEKQREGERLAMELALVPRDDSVVFQATREITKEEFEREAKARLAEAQEARRDAKADRKSERADELIRASLEALPTDPGSALSRRQILASLVGKGAGKPALEASFDALVGSVEGVESRKKGNGHEYWRGL